MNIPFSKYAITAALCMYVGGASAMLHVTSEEIEEASKICLTGQLIDAAAHNDIEECRKLLELGADSEEELGDRSALKEAIIRSSTGLFELFIDHGLDLNKAQISDFSILGEALSQKKFKLAEFLVSKGADVELDHEGRSNLIKILDYRGRASKECAPACKFLLDHGASPHVADRYGFTPLIHAAFVGCHEICAMPEFAGTYELVENLDHRTAFLFAAWGGHTKCCEVLAEKGANIHAKTKHGKSALMLAASRGEAEIVEMLLRLGVDPHEVDNNGKTALYMAAEKGQEEVCALLAPCTNDGQLISQALVVAIEKGKKQICPIIAPYTKHIPGQGPVTTPLMAAISQDDVELVKLLLQYYPHINGLDEFGNTAFSIGAKRRNSALCALLVDHMRTLRQGIVSLLAILKYRLPYYAAKTLYRQRMDLIAPYFMEKLACLPPSIVAFLNQENNLGETAFDHLAPAELIRCLEPEVPMLVEQEEQRVEILPDDFEVQQLVPVEAAQHEADNEVPEVREVRQSRANSIHSQYDSSERNEELEASFLESIHRLDLTEEEEQEIVSILETSTQIEQSINNHIVRQEGQDKERQAFFTKQRVAYFVVAMIAIFLLKERIQACATHVYTKYLKAEEDTQQDLPSINSPLVDAVS